MRRLLAAGGCVAALALVLAAPALGDTVQITVHGTSFSGTITNTGTKAHNFISIGTEAGKANPIESFQIQGGKNIQPYAKYGSYFGSVMIKPGETVSFHGTTKKPTTAFNMPTSDDGGMDNADNHVTATGGSPPPSSTEATTPPPNPGPGGTNTSSGSSVGSWLIWVLPIFLSLVLLGGFVRWLFGREDKEMPSFLGWAFGSGGTAPEKDPVPDTGDSSGPEDQDDRPHAGPPPGVGGETSPPPDMQLQWDEPEQPAEDAVPSTGDSSPQNEDIV